MHDFENYPQFKAEEFLTPGSDITVVERSVSEVKLHWHDYFEIEVITEGNGVHLLNGREYPLSKGSAFLVKPTDYHKVISSEPMMLYNVTFRERILSESTLLRLAYSGFQKICTFEGSVYDSVLMTVKLIQNESDSSGEYQKQLLSYLLHFFEDNQSADIPSEHLTGIRKALIYLELHFRERITLNMLADIAGFHPTYFSEIFRSTTGETYIEKLNSLRLEYACVLLSNGRSVSYACYESGFGSLSNFYTAFKKKYGRSPKEYRKGGNSE